MKSLLLLLLLVGSLPAATTFTGTGVSADINVSDQHTLAVTLSGTFVATVVLEQAVSGGYVPLQAWNTTVTYKPPRLTGICRLRCTDYTSGTVTYTLTSIADNQVIYRKPNGSTAFSVDVDGLVTSAGGAISGGSIDNAPIGATTPSTGAFTTLSATGAITSTLATGTAPFVVASTTNVANLNASSLGGATFAAPGTIGGGTPAAATFTTVTATDTTAASMTSPGGYTSTVATGTAPFTATSTTACPNLNASALLGGTWTAPGTIGSGTPSTGAFTTLTSSGLTSVSNATDATDSATGALAVVGGVTMAKNLWVGANALAGVTMNLNCAAANGAFVRFDAANVLRWDMGKTGSTHNFQIDDYNSSGVLVDSPLVITEGAGGAFTVVRPVSITSTTDSTSAATGSLIVSGGGGFTKNIVGKQGLGVGVTSVTTAAGTTAMTTSSTACQVFTGSTTQTLTLPAANAFGAGIAFVVYVKNVSTGTVTVQRAGSDTINSTASNVTSFTLAQWASCTLYSDGVSAWERF